MCSCNSGVGDMPCAVIDLVLAEAFEWRELEDFIRAAIDSCVPIPELLAKVPHAEQTFHVAHALCHEEGPFRARLERRLDRRHLSWLRLLKALDDEEIAERMLAGSGPNPCDHAGVLWALGRDPRITVRRLLPAFLARTQLQAFQSLASIQPPTALKA